MKHFTTPARRSKWLRLLPSFMTLAFAQAACSPGAIEESNLSIQGGRFTDQYPAVVQIQSFPGGLCTASFISPRTLITAAHCVDAAETVRIIAGPSAESRRIYIHPTWRENGETRHQYDLAFVDFDHDVSQNYYPLSWSPEDQSIGQSVTMVGYGCEKGPEWEGGGPKREGFNRISELRDGSIVSTAKRDGSAGSAVCPGDSGGPLLANGKILGVASWLAWTETDTWSYHTNLGTETLQNFMLALGDIAQPMPSRPEPFFNAMIESKLTEQAPAGSKLYIDICKDPSIINQSEWCRAQVYAQVDGGKPNQRFQMKRLDGDFVVLKENQDGQCLAVTSSGYVVAERCADGWWTQEWELKRVGKSEFHTLRNRHLGKCIDVPEGRAENGNRLIVYDCHQGNNQQWRFAPN